MMFRGRRRRNHLPRMLGLRLVGLWPAGRAGISVPRVQGHALRGDTGRTDHSRQELGTAEAIGSVRYIPFFSVNDFLNQRARPDNAELCVQRIPSVKASGVDTEKLGLRPIG